jgi:Mg/Co/Ni transporter MgtE
VYDLIGGRASWTVLGLPTEGAVGDRGRISSVVRLSPTVPIDSTVREIVALGSAPGETIAVVDERGVLLGAVDAGAVALPPDTPIERIMMPAPSTIRPDLRVDEVVQRLRKDQLESIFVTAINGTLFGVASLKELDVR